MKKVCVSMIVLCLIVQNLPASRGLFTGNDLDYQYSAELVKVFREEFKDAEKLKRHVGGLFMRGATSPAIALWFKRRFNISDELMRDMLMGMYRESLAIAGWRKYQEGDSRDVRNARILLEEAIKWLGACADAETKELLLDIVTDKEKDGPSQSAAINAYLCCADMQEVCDMIPRVIAGNVGTYGRSTAYYVAMLACDGAENDEQKRKVIIETVSNLLMKESDKSVFEDADKHLSRRSKEYAESPQRKAAQERFKKPPDKEVK